MEPTMIITMLISGGTALTGVIYALKKGVKRSKCCFGELELDATTSSSPTKVIKTFC